MQRIKAKLERLRIDNYTNPKELNIVFEVPENREGYKITKMFQIAGFGCFGRREDDKWAWNCELPPIKIKIQNKEVSDLTKYLTPSMKKYLGPRR